MFSRIQQEGKESNSLIRCLGKRYLAIWQETSKSSTQCHQGEITIILQFGMHMECFQKTKITACFVIAASGHAEDLGTASQLTPSCRPWLRWRNHRSENIVLFSEHAGLLDSVRFFRTDLGKTRWSSCQPAKPNRTSLCKVNPEIYINKYSSGP